MLDGNPTQLTDYAGLANGNVSVTYRSVDYGTSELTSWNNLGDNYFYTVGSSDFPASQNEPLYNTNMSLLKSVASRSNDQGFYLHEVLTYLASVNGWNWSTALSQLNFTWLNNVVAIAKAQDKKVIWSEPSYAWQTLYQSAAVRAKLAEWGNTIVPMYGTNFPTQVASAQYYAAETAVKYHMSLGESDQGWYFRDMSPSQTPTESGSLVLAQGGWKYGVTYYQFEGAPADFLWTSSFMLGVRDFSSYLSTNLPPPVTAPLTTP
jgi:hypothetical protein